MVGRGGRDDRGRSWQGEDDRAAKVRVFSVVSVELELRGGEAPQLTAIAHGYVVSSGWSDVELVPLERKLSADGILDLDFVAMPPGEFDMPVLSPVSAVLEWKTSEVGRLMGVRVVSRTNEITKLVVRSPAQSTKQPIGETTQIAGEGQHPHFAAEAAFTTTILGEEGGGLPPTHLLGEHGGGFPPTTHMLGEEGGGLPPTTHMLGEEGGGLPPTTHMLGEEGGGLPPTTHMLGEEGGGLPPTTHMLGEEGGGLPPGGQAEAAQRSTMTTLALGEEGGGGGTVLTTLVVGEEGTTAPWFEEMMPGPVIQPTGLLGEQGGGQQNPTTQMVGEGWYDPANQNPLGRR